MQVEDLLEVFEHWAIDHTDVVDSTKFSDYVDIEFYSLKKFCGVRMGHQYFSKVYSLSFDGKWPKERLREPPSLGKKLILKFYDYENKDCFSDEILALGTIMKHNTLSGEKIGVPEVYDYGVMKIGSDGINFSLFILMSYVEDEEEDMDESQRGYAKKKINRDTKTLKKIGIEHGVIRRSNMRINKNNPMLIDYSHANVKHLEENQETSLRPIPRIRRRAPTYVSSVEIAVDLADLRKWAIIHGINYSKFNNVVDIDIKELKTLWIGRTFSEYELSYNNNWDKKRFGDEPVPGTRLLIKVIHFDSPGYFQREVLTHRIITDHNKVSYEKVRLPEEFDFGFLILSKNKVKKVWGYYILRSIVTNKEDAMTPREVRYARRQLNKDIKILKRLGIDRYKIRINRHNPMTVEWIMSWL